MNAIIHRAPLVLAALSLACSSTPSSKPALAPEVFRTAPPEAGPAPKLVAPIPTRTMLGNGLTLMTVHKPGLPLVDLRIVLRSGSAADPADLPGLAGFVAAMLKEGTRSRSAKKIADEIETLGTSLHISVDEDSTTLSFSCLEENFLAVFDVVTDVLRNPAFADKEVKRVRKRRIAALARTKDDASSLARRVFRRTLFDDHPYGHTVLGEEQAIKKIGKVDLAQFYAFHYQPGTAAVVVVGSLTNDRARAEVEKRLADWSGGGAVNGELAAPKAPAAGVNLVDKPGAPQSQLRIGHLGVERSHSDYFPLVVMNAALGGMFNSRINMNLREDKGYTYGARSSFDFLRSSGAFVVSTGVRTDATKPAIQEVLKEIDAVRDTGLTAKELEVAKARYSLSLSGYFQTVGAIGDMVANIYLHGLPADYYQMLPDEIAEVDLAAANRVAKEHLDPKQLIILVVGDRQQVETALGELNRGAVQLRDSDAQPAK